MNDLTTEINRTCDFLVRNGIDVPIYVKVGFIQRDQFNQQIRNIDSFYRSSVVNAQCNIGSEQSPDAGIVCNYVFDKI